MAPRAAPWLRLARRMLPDVVWSGAGTVVRKAYFERGAGGGLVTVGRFQQGFVSGHVPPRWVVVVADDAGKEHYVGVEQLVWEQCEAGDVITKQEPLIEIDRRGLAGILRGRRVK